MTFLHLPTKYFHTFPKDFFKFDAIILTLELISMLLSNVGEVELWEDCFPSKSSLRARLPNWLADLPPRPRLSSSSSGAARCGNGQTNCRPLSTGPLLLRRSAAAARTSRPCFSGRFSSNSSDCRILWVSSSAKSSKDIGSDTRLDSTASTLKKYLGVKHFGKICHRFWENGKFLVKMGFFFRHQNYFKMFHLIFTYFWISHLILWQNLCLKLQTRCFKKRKRKLI